MKLKKRTKSRKMRGTRLHGYAMKKHKGKGNRGGVGMAGTGKRADQKKTLVMVVNKDYFGKHGKRAIKKFQVINVGDIQKNIGNYKDKEINLKGYKILGQGELKDKIIINADFVSKRAKEKIEKVGGKVNVKERTIKKKVIKVKKAILTKNNKSKSEGALPSVPLKSKLRGKEKKDDAKKTSS